MYCGFTFCIGDFALSQPPSATMTSVDGVAMMMPAAQPLQQQPATVTFVGQLSPMAVRSPTVLTGYLHRRSIRLGITLIIIGIWDAVFNIVDIVTFVALREYNSYWYNSMGIVGHGLWGGILVRNDNILLFSLLLAHSALALAQISIDNALMDRMRAAGGLCEALFIT